MNLRHINYMYFISYCIFLSDFRLQIVKDTYMKDHLFRRSDLLPPNIIKHETNTFSQHIEIKYLSWEKYNISNLRTCHIASQNDHERATIRIFFFQHHVIIFKQFCVVFFYFQVHCVVNVHPPRICSKWFSGSVTVTRWWIQWFMASQAKNSNVPSVTSLAVNAGKAKDLGKYSAIHSTITMNDQIAIFHLPTRKWSPLNST